MDRSFYIKRRDTSPALRFTLDPAVNLVGATARFNMRERESGDLVADRVAAEIVAPAAEGIVEFRWRPQDTALAGNFEAEFEITYADGSIESWPNVGFIPVVISEDIG